jgi:hypothetical protein
MEQEMKEQATSLETGREVPAITPSQGEVIEALPAQEIPCPTCAGGAVATSYVYALGGIEARFPNLAAEKEFAQATGGTDTAGKTDHRPSSVLSSARTATWHVTVLGADHPGLDTYCCDHAIRRTSICWWKPSVGQPQ